MSYKIKHYPEKCNGCEECIKACKEHHDGLSNCAIYNLNGKYYYFACYHCKKPLCAEACPVGAMERKEEVVVFYPELCIGCLNCADVCPFAVPKFNKNTGKITKCDMCIERIKNGKLPYCVEACPNQALELIKVEPKRRAVAK
jgi:Fe-S-cluster-containing dehydrogenase component